MNYLLILALIALNFTICLTGPHEVSEEMVQMGPNKMIKKKFENTKDELHLTNAVQIDAKPCNDQHLVSVFIHSAGRTTGKYFYTRQSLRKTWVSQLKDLNISVYFVIALNKNETINQELREEAERHQDMIQFGFIDNYNNLTLKAISVLRWIHKKCLSSTYILKTDDDAIVNSQLLLDKLSQFRDGISGNCGQGVQPYRDPNNKWYMPLDYYPNDTYPDYVSGPAYMMAGNITHTLLKTIDEYSGHFFVIDDLLITGFIAEKAGIARHSTELIEYLNCKNVCPLHQRVAIFECKDSQEIDQFWSEWKNTSCHYVSHLKFVIIAGIVIFFPLAFASCYLYRTLKK